MRQKFSSHRFCALLTSVVLTCYCSSFSFAQDQTDKDTPKEQLPVHERDRGDSFIENLGEVPGRIVTLPLWLVFKGVAAVTGWAVEHNIYLGVTDLLTNEDATRKVRPVFTPPAGGGLTFKQENLFTPGMTFRAKGSFGTRSRRYLGGSLTDLQLFSSNLGLQVLGFHHRKPDDDFFGIGNDAPEADESNYLIQNNNFEMDLLSAPFKNTQFFLGFAYNDAQIEPGRDPNRPSIEELFSPGEAPGLAGVEMWSFLLKYYHDSRNVLGHPTKGGEEFISVEFAQEIGGDDFGFRQYTFDMRRYVELFYRRVLALRLRTQISDNMSGRAVPFYRLPGLGEQDVLSGYRPVRYRDNDLMLVGLEYRFPIHSFVYTILFIEEGRVFSNIFDEFTVNDWKYSFGGGLRISGQDGGLVTSFGIARSAEQTRFVFGLNVELRSF